MSHDSKPGLVACGAEFMLKHGYHCELPKDHEGDHEAQCPNPQFHQSWPNEPAPVSESRPDAQPDLGIHWDGDQCWQVVDGGFVRRSDLERVPDAQGGPSAEPQLVHSARESILARWAKYSDPKNPDWEFEAASRWERHAINAVLDLVRVEASERSLREQLSRKSEVKK